jgi:hypothetical protein
MDMVVHQAVRLDVNSALPGETGEHGEVKPPVLISEKDRLAAVPPLVDMMRTSLNNNASFSWHETPPLPAKCWGSSGQDLFNFVYPSKIYNKKGTRTFLFLSVGDS